MPMGAGRFENVFKRLDVELDRLERIGVPKQEITNIRTTILKYKPVDELSSSAALGKGIMATTPYQVAFNRLEGLKRGDYTYEYYEKAWLECSPEDQAALNEYAEKGEQ